jgi:hypothetical protein
MMKMMLLSQNQNQLLLHMFPQLQNLRQFNQHQCSKMMLTFLISLKEL